MRTYLYRCVEGHITEQQGGLDDDLKQCPCGKPARRRPFSSVPHLKGETVSRGIPDPAYRQEAEKRDLNRTWGDATRSIELLRANRVEDREGHVSIDTAKVTRES